MPSRRDNHQSTVDFAAALRRQGVLHTTATQDFGEPTTTGSKPPNRLQKKKTQGAFAETLPGHHECSTSGQTAATRTVLSESPWACYNELYSLQFGTSVYFPIAERKQFSPEDNPLCIVKSFSGANAKECIQSVQRIRHQQFVQALDFFFVQEEYFVVFEYMPLSLAEVAGNLLMDDLRLASIMGQVRTALFVSFMMVSETNRSWTGSCT